MQRIISFILTVFLLSGCALTGVQSKTGKAIFTFITESGDSTFNKGDISKWGRACSYNVFGFISYGDSGILAAKKAGNVKRVYFFDTEYSSFGFIFGQVCTKVYGK